MVKWIFLAALSVVQSAFPETDALAPQVMEPLPLGAVRPKGWLKFQLDRMTEGLVGRLYENSEFLTPSNGWLKAEGEGWEEQPYWFRSFVKLAVLTQNERCLAVSRDWVEKILATKDGDGWFGPKGLKAHRFADGRALSDIWGHMVMCEALWSWWEHSGDARVMKLLTDFADYCVRMPDDQFIAWDDGRREPKDWVWKYWIQRDRGGDLLPVLFRLYERTGNRGLLALSDRLIRKCKPPMWMFLDHHTVNFAQRLTYWTLYSRRSGLESDRASAGYWYDLHMAMWGQMPRGVYASDENLRHGSTDARDGTESCSWGELTRSFNLLGDLTGETKWADRNEDIVFNHAPCAYTPDWKEIHYITAANQVNLDARTDHNYDNCAPQAAYSSRLYRCCRHNAAMTFPVFTENLVKRAADGALVFWMYAPHEGRTRIGDNEISWTFETCYPFREKATLVIQAARPFTARFRVPGWAKGFAVGDRTATSGAAWLDVALPAGETRRTMTMKAECAYTFWPRSGGVTVDRGPLSYSLAIGERTAVVGREVVPKVHFYDAGDLTGSKDTLTEYLPTTPWNYGLDVTAPLVFRTRDWCDDCFVSTNAACEIVAKGRRLPSWTLQDNQPAALQSAPAYTDEPLQDLRFVPLGCQRLRLSVLPQVTDDRERGRVWKPVPATTPRKERSPRL